MSSAYRTPPRPLVVNYDESRVPAHTLPDALRCEDGTAVMSRELWNARRRGKLLELFTREIYGRPARHLGVHCEERGRDPRALGGLATRLELDVRISFETGPGDATPPVLELCLWLPNAPGPHPVFLGMNHSGNHGVHPDPSLRITRQWVPAFPELGLETHVATDASRGLHARGWPIEFVLSRGYALATFYAGDIEADFPDGARARTGITKADDDDAAGSIAMWAFGLSRALDALEKVESVDPARVALIGHSRLGKAALWAAAQDPRFALVAANGSGHGGAALFRRCFGERARDLSERFPHWFCRNFRRYADRENALPVDQHELLALIAPRPLALGTAELDLWSDPRGELLAWFAARPAYALFGAGEPAVSLENVPLGRPLGERLSYHRRAGNHDLTKADWWHYLAFADRFLRATGGAAGPA